MLIEDKLDFASFLDYISVQFSPFKTDKILSVLNRGVNIPDTENVTLEKMQNLIYPQLEIIKSLRRPLAWHCGIMVSEKKVPVWRYLGCKNTNSMETSFTIAIGRIGEIKKNYRCRSLQYFKSKVRYP